MPKAIIYCRVSTEEQANKGLSLDAQERTCRKSAEEMGYTSIETIRDEGESAGSMNRPGLQRILKLCEEGKVNTLFMVHSDRLARNTEDHLRMRRLFQQHDVKVVYAFQPGLSDATAFGKTMDTVMAAFNEMQRLVISEKTKGALLEKVKEGWFPGVAPLGYRNVANPDFRKGEISRKIIVPDPNVAPLIQEMFRLYAGGDYSVYELVEIMYRQGLRSRRDKKLHPSKAYETLHNPLYVGELHWGGLVIRSAKHQPLIDRATFQQVQAVIAGHNHHACRRRKYQFLLRGFAYCGSCGRRLTAEWHFKKSGLKFSYYHCPQWSGCAHPSYLVAAALEGQVEDRFKEIRFSDHFIHLVIHKARLILEGKAFEIASRKRELYNQKTAIEQKRDVAEEKLFKGVITDEDFLRNRGRFRMELDRIQDELDALEEHREVQVDEIHEMLRFARNIHSAYRDAPYALKRQYLGFFWERFETKDKTLVKAVPTKLFQALLDLRQVQLRGLMGREPGIIRTDLWRVITDDAYMFELKQKFASIRELQSSSRL